MKKLSFILMFFPMMLFAQKKYVINGNVKGLKDSTLVFLVNAQGNTVAQNYAKAQKFSFTGTTANPEIYQINFTGTKEFIEVFLDNNPVTVAATFGNFKDAQISGAPYHAQYQHYIQEFNPLRSKIEQQIALINKEPQGKKRDSLINAYTLTRNKIANLASTAIATKPASPVTAFILFALNPLFKDQPGVLEEKYNLLQGAAKSGVYGQTIAQIIASTKIGEVGTMAADFTQNDTANNPIKLSSFKGKYVLVDFWASWCGPCRQENPNVVAAFNAFSNKGFTILGVSLDRDKSRWLKAIADDKLTWTHVSDLQYWNNAVAQMYQISSIPANILIDPTGKIIAKNLRGEELFQKLQSLLK